MYVTTSFDWTHHPVIIYKYIFNIYFLFDVNINKHLFLNNLLHFFKQSLFIFHTEITHNYLHLTVNTIMMEKNNVRKITLYMNIRVVVNMKKTGSKRSWPDDLCTTGVDFFSSFFAATQRQQTKRTRHPSHARPSRHNTHLNVMDQWLLQFSVSVRAHILSMVRCTIFRTVSISRNV